MTFCEQHEKPKALDAFAGEGGATAGLQRAGYCVTAVDSSRARLRRNPAEHVTLVDDAVPYIAQHSSEFALRWASPPCQDYSIGTSSMRAAGRSTGYARLIPATRIALQQSDAPWIIENVYGARAEMINPTLLCGRMFNLATLDEDGEPLVMDRHRLFETSFAVVAPAHPSHTPLPVVAGAYGGARRRKGASPAERRLEARAVRKGGYVPAKSVQEALLGITWMTQRGLYLSIPPAYAEYIARQAM